MNSSPLWNVVAICFLLIQACGNDSQVTIVEENVPNPPLNDPPIADVPKPKPPRTLPPIPTPALREIPESIAPPVPPTFSTDSEDAAIASLAEFTLVDSVTDKPLGAHNFAKGTKLDCALIENEASPLFQWYVHFESATAPEKTPFKLRISSFHSALERSLSIEGEKTSELKLEDKIWKVTDRITLQLGGEPLIEPSPKKLYENVRKPEHSSLCQIELEVDAKGLAGKFDCKNLWNFEISRANAKGSFRCPLRRSNRYLISRE